MLGVGRSLSSAGPFVMPTVSSTPAASTLATTPSTTAMPSARTPATAHERASAQELSTATSLDDLFKAILGDQAGDVDDRALLLETVEAQVRGIRDELGLPEPIVEPPAPVRLVRTDLSEASDVDAHDEASHGVLNGVRSATKRVPGLFKLVAGLAWSRLPHPVLLFALAGGALTIR